MTRRQSQAQRKAAFMEAAGEMFERVEKWYDENPEASFGEIEAEARERRRELMGKSMEIWINGRDNGYQVEEVICQKCGGGMEFEGYRKWKVVGLEGETELERAYYVCPKCKGETIFPPGQEIKIEKGSLE